MNPVDETSRRVVYVSYDGLSDPLGQSQVLPYVMGLAERGHRFDVLSFEKPGVPLRFREGITERVAWTALRYHQTPTVPATALDMTQGLATLGLLAGIRRADLVHARSYVACTLALPYCIAAGVPLLFDTRGLWPDEKVEAGSWTRESRVYRGAKAAERRLMARSDAITVLTHAFRDYLRSDYPHRAEIESPIHVIPTCVDLDLFSPEVEPDRAMHEQLGGARALVYAGSLGGFYMAKKIAEFYLRWRLYRRSARLLIVSRQDPAEIREALADAGVESELLHRSASRNEVPGLLRCADAAIAFDGRGFGGVGTAPTKLGEALACGLPMAVSAVGDVERVLSGAKVGVVMRDTSSEGLDRAARELAELAELGETREAARRHAESWFNLRAGLDAYDRLYRQLPMRRAYFGKSKSSMTDTSWPPPAPRRLPIMERL